MHTGEVLGANKEQEVAVSCFGHFHFSNIDRTDKSTITLSIIMQIEQTLYEGSLQVNQNSSDGDYKKGAAPSKQATLFSFFCRHCANIAYKIERCCHNLSNTGIFSFNVITKAIHEMYSDFL